MSSAQRNRAVDVLKLILALMVVGIHANPFAPLGRTAILLTGDGLFRLAVPVFLLFNGYFLQAALLRGRGWGYVRHAAQLYVLWMLLYLPLYYPLLAARGLWPNLRTLLFGYWHLWYLAGMVLAGALIVLIQAWPSRRLAWLMTCSFLGGILVTYGMAFGLITPNKAIFSDPLLANRNPVFLCLPFMLAGLLIAREDLAARFDLSRLQLLTLLGIALTLAESLLIARFAFKGVAHDNMLALGLAAPCLMLLALKSRTSLKGRALGDYASGIYFIHVAFCALLFRFADLSRPVIYAMAVVGSVGLVALIRRAGLAPRML